MTKNKLKSSILIQNLTSGQDIFFDHIKQNQINGKYINATGHCVILLLIVQDRPLGIVVS